MDLNSDAACLKLSSRQLGLITREQTLNRGLSEDAIFRRVDSGKWRQIFPGVYAVSGSPDSWMQKQLGACLWSWGVASHRAGAAVWGLEDFNETLVEVTTERWLRSPLIGLVIHRRTLDRRDKTNFKGIPVTTPGRTLIDLASVVDIGIVEVALQDALRKGLVTVPRLRLLLDRSGGKGKQGVGALRALIGDIQKPRRITETRLETLLLKLLTDAGLPPPMLQYPIREGSRQIARVDFAYPDEMLIIEGDSFSFHSAPEDYQRDRDRSNALVRLGWRILRVTWEDLVYRPNKVVEAIRAALAPTPRKQAQGG